MMMIVFVVLVCIIMIIISLKNSVKLTNINDQIKYINKIKQRNVPSSTIIFLYLKKCLAIILMGYYGKP